METHRGQNLFDLADRLKALRDEKHGLQERLKQINADIDDVDYRLSTDMAFSETQNFTRCGTMFS